MVNAPESEGPKAKTPLDELKEFSGISLNQKKKRLARKAKSRLIPKVDFLGSEHSWGGRVVMKSQRFLKTKYVCVHTNFCIY